MGRKAMTELRRRKPWEESEPCLPSTGATRTKPLGGKGLGVGAVCQRKQPGAG